MDVNNLYVNALNAAPAGSAADTEAHALTACRAWLDTLRPEVVVEIQRPGTPTPATW